MRLLALLTLLTSTLSSPLFAAAVPAALLPPPAELISRQPIQWDIPRAISVDVTCDGNPDTLVIGYQGPHQFWLHLQPSGDVGEWGESIHFALTPAPAEGATLCQVPIQIQPATRACRSGQAVGCCALPGCPGFILSDGLCGQLHFYWDPQQQRLDYWRE